MKKSMKLIIVAIIILMVVLSSTMVFAVDDPVKYTGEGSTVDTGRLDTFGQDIVKIVTTVGSIASVIILVILGIKYMMGSAEEKAEYKKTLMPYVIGAVFVFAASVIASAIFNVANSMLK